MFSIHSLGLFLFVGLMPAMAIAQVCDGQFVFNDTNRNGIFDNNEKGVGNVLHHAGLVFAHLHSSSDGGKGRGIQCVTPDSGRAV